MALGEGRIPLQGCSQKGRFAGRAPYLVPGLGWAAAVPENLNLLFPVIVGGTRGCPGVTRYILWWYFPSYPKAVLPIHNHQDRSEGPGLVLSHCHRWRRSWPVLAQHFRNWVLWPKGSPQARATASVGWGSGRSHREGAGLGGVIIMPVVWGWGPTAESAGPARWKVWARRAPCLGQLSSATANTGQGARNPPKGRSSGLHRAWRRVGSGFFQRMET